jgi:acyl-CoA thioester hydrolase
MTNNPPAFSREIALRWADADPNFHIRHSVYYDWAATTRLDFLAAHGLTLEKFQALHIGVILFREECVFRKEIRLGERITINLELVKSRKDYSRWTIRHQIRKMDGTMAAIITVDGAWMDVIKRKLAIPPADAASTFEAIPRSEDFQWEETA